MVFDGGDKAKLGIVAAGKSYLDVRQALEDLGIDEARASAIGVRLLKIGMVWPLEPSIIRDFARGLETIIVVEEKRSFIETQLKDILYGEKNRPAVIGKTDEKGAVLFPSHGVLDPVAMAMAIAARVKDRATAACARNLQASLPVARNQAELASRIPYFCAGCPHSSSTRVPEGARAYAGIGCHWLAQFVPDRRTEGFTHMGGEGANWVGEAPFSKRAHVFQNIGDGTYNHSGLMAIRHAVNSGVNITYKILYNDAVAMTGGQRNDGSLTVPAIARQMRAFGVDRIAIVSDEPEKYPAGAGFPPHVTFHHRDDLQTLQGELQTVTGASVLIYDQTCAAEKRRRRKKGTFPDPNRRVFINELVCEGCGDCGVQSNCVAIQPVETPFGRKRQIDQSSCNKDFSCLKGFCPSFVTVEGASLVRGKKPTEWPAADAKRVQDWWFENEYQGAKQIIDGPRAEMLAIQAKKKVLEDTIPATLVMADLPPVSAQLQAGRLRALAVASGQRSRFLPDVPSLTEAGFPNTEFEVWLGLYAPAKTPREIVERVGGELRRYLASPAAREAFERIGHEPDAGGGDVVRARNIAEQKTLGAIARSVNSNQGK